MGAGPSLAVNGGVDASPVLRPVLVVTAPTPDELHAHRAYLEALDRETKGRCVWLAAAPGPV